MVGDLSLRERLRKTISLSLRRSLKKIAALMTEGYLEERAMTGSRAKYEAILAKIPDVELEIYDR